MPQGNTDRNKGVGRGGEGRARRVQDPTGALRGERDTFGHEKSHLLVDLRRLGFVRVRTLVVSDGASQEKGGRSSDQLRQVGRHMSEQYVSFDTTEKKILIKRFKCKKL